MNYEELFTFLHDLKKRHNKVLRTIEEKNRKLQRLRFQIIQVQEAMKRGVS